MHISVKKNYVNNERMELQTEHQEKKSMNGVLLSQVEQRVVINSILVCYCCGGMCVPFPVTLSIFFFLLLSALPRS